MVGNLVIAPVVGHIGYQDPSAARGVDVDDVGAGPVAGDDAAAGQGADGLRADRDVLGDDRFGVPGDVDDLVFGLALGGDQLKADAFDDGALDGHVTVVVVGDDDGLCISAAHVLIPASGGWAPLRLRVA